MIPISIQKSASIAVAVMCFSVIQFGCSRPSLYAADPEFARDMLQTALAHWKTGNNPEELKKLRPSLYFTDLQQNAGAQLLAFEVLPGHEMIGFQVKLKAKLQLSPVNRGTVERTATYLIDTGPHRVIVPGDG